MYYYL